MSAPFNSHELKILWNIKANEVLIEALKRSPPREHNLLWLASLAQENSELKSRSLLYEPFQIWVRKYNPDQPRVPAGSSDGGQWTDDGGGGSGKPLTQEAFDRRWGTASKPASETRIVSGHGRFVGGVALAKTPGTGPKAPDGTPVQLAQSGGGRRGSGPNIRIIAGRAQEVTPEQELRIETSRIRADEAVRRVQQRDAGWKPQPGLYDSAEGLIRYNESVAREAEYRERELSSNWLGQNGGPPLNNPSNSGQRGRYGGLLDSPLAEPRPTLPPPVPGHKIDYDKVSTAKPYEATEPRNLEEQVLWNEVIRDPGAGKLLNGLNNDPRFPVENGWQKMYVTHRKPDGKVLEVHYQFNFYTGKAYDIKLKNKD
ncbi:hypothetical protein J2X72_002551 [Phyllobacterium sp. 1468]|uniref:hypothetical protein n=1 Tax=Phyllobacterium sp. 1468 TaxID=2817759 RepID=UPI0028545035|nr:hypothetical protein [Phyllobacterium sp. 1468]MDR6633751.1 hypothetical protein [Phyllobacterium sp. 1468]